MRNVVVVAAVALVLALVMVAGGPVTNGPNPLIVGGIVNGAVYGLLAIGLVLVYKGTRVFNFAQGEFGTLAAYLAAVTIERAGMPYWGGVLAAVAGVAVVALVVERLFFRPLLDAPRITVLVATIAVALLAVGAEILIFGIEPLPLRPVVAATDASGTPTGVEVLGYFVPPQGAITVGVLAALGALLAWFFARTDLGLAILATSQDRFATRVVGIGVARMSRFIWVAAAVLGAIAGIAYAPQVGFVSAGLLTQNVVIPAFTAAVLGGMSSLPGAFLGGLVVGVVQALAAWAANFVTIGGTPLAQDVPGADQLSVLLVLLVVLMIRPQGLLGRET
ncbi:MAG TPA: branched-chain amino acid ABC transporter permease [Actinomycetota bacterium]|nr:branched-chain amino acid ABC transporter permease [Actinomycetota bacterium]